MKSFPPFIGRTAVVTLLMLACSLRAAEPETVDAAMDQFQKAFFAKKYQEANDILEAARRDFPTMPPTDLEMGAVKYQLGAYDAAEHCLEAAVKNDPKDDASFAFLASTKAKLKRWDWCMANAKRMLELSGKMPVLKAFIAWGRETHNPEILSDALKGVDLEAVIREDPGSAAEFIAAYQSAFSAKK